MSLAKDITKYISTNTALTVGTNLFLAYLPQNVDVGVTISDMGGFENDTNMLRAQLHIASVANDYTTAENNAYVVFNKLVYTNGFTIDSGYVFNCVPISTPTYIGFNEQQKVIVTCSVAIFKEK